MYLLYSVNVYIFNVVIEIKFYSISILFHKRDIYEKYGVKRRGNTGQDKVEE